MRTVATAIVSAALAVGALFGYVASVTSIHAQVYHPHRVVCATEDSCTPGYSGVLDAWVIQRDTP